MSGQWNKASDDELMYAFAANVTASIKEQQQALGLYNDFLYLNDAGPSQKPYSSYGKDGCSLAKLQAIQAKYDPKGFYNTFLSHGFPLAA
jgi:hypothetical protein